MHIAIDFNVKMIRFAKSFPYYIKSHVRNTHNMVLQDVRGNLTTEIIFTQGQT